MLPGVPVLQDDSLRSWTSTYCLRPGANLVPVAEVACQRADVLFGCFCDHTVQKRKVRIIDLPCEEAFVDRGDELSNGNGIGMAGIAALAVVAGIEQMDG